MNAESSGEVLALTRELIARESVTPADAGCQTLLAERLARAGLEIRHWRFGEVENLFATHGDGAPHLLFLGHTDVVPPGPLEQWTSPPFAPTLRDGRLYGRGAADMKGAVAALVLALERFVADTPNHRGRISLLLTSDEEGIAVDGVARVVPELERLGWLPDHVLVGEPSSSQDLGDVIRVGRRGSIQARMVVTGIQGHTAYAAPDTNPAHRLAPLVHALAALQFDDGDQAFPATTLQISNLIAGAGAENVTPGTAEVWFNLRHNPNSDAETLRRQVIALIEQCGLNPTDLQWRISGAPFGPARGVLLESVQDALRSQRGKAGRPDTGGGTSDGRFFGPRGIEVVELGPVNQSIHQVDEWVDLDALFALPSLYRDVCARVLPGG